MISYIRGLLAELSEDGAVVESGGIGYLIHIPGSVLGGLPQVGTEIVLYTYFQVREDAMSLYGFLNRQDRDMFKQLIGVNGIGPKAALGILSALSPHELRLAIISGDAKAISKAPGVGAKSAQRVILDLKDRISAKDYVSQQSPEAAAVSLHISGSAQEAVDALTALGYSGTEASRAVELVEVTEDMTSEDVLKASLKHLSFL